MANEHWSGKRSLISQTQDEQPTNPKHGDFWVDTDDNTGEDKTEVYNSSDVWRRASKWKWGKGADYGYICGGFNGTNNFSTIERITFPFDSGTASNVGNLNRTKRFLVANNSSLHGYICGGTGDSGVDAFTTIERITFPFDSGTASNVGGLSGSRRESGGNNSSLHGYICGGFDNTNYYSTIERITFPFDSGTASNVGSLTSTRRLSVANNSTQHGFICGGRNNLNFISTIDRITFPFNSGTANNVGSLSGTRIHISSNNSSLHGFICGGNVGGVNRLSTIERITFPFNSGTATNVGNLSGTKEQLGANNSSQHGYICGGYDGTNYLSSIDRITFPFNSGTATNVGNLNSSNSLSSTTDGTDFVSQLI